MCTRLLFAFGRRYGYRYLRHITQFLVHQIEQIPKSCSLEVDPAHLLSSEVIDANTEVLLLVTKALIEELKASTDDMPRCEHYHDLFTLSHSFSRVVKEMCRYISEAVYATLFSTFTASS
jgi:hypothetical protein